jgi:carbonic anhydrase/acetyltransferase-like protein (isoleucine patch superfamily)
MRPVAEFSGVTSVLLLGALLPGIARASGSEGCHPTRADLPVCPSDSPAETASFLDPTVLVVGGRHVTLAESIYVGPFAELIASRKAPISIGAESNVQDSVLIQAARDDEDRSGGHRQSGTDAPGGNGDAAEGVEIAERVILAHGTSVYGPAQIGIEGSDIAPDPDDDQEVFLSFGSQVDGAVLEKNTGISALGRVGPGVRLRSGYIVLPGKNVTTQAEADDPALGKVRLINEADVAFNEAVLEVNIAFAREYTELSREDSDAVLGVSVDPGGTAFNPGRDIPTFAGTERVDPEFRNRVIGEIDFADGFWQLSRASGHRISLRADEGEHFVVGHVAEMGDEVTFHALEHSDLQVGDDVAYGDDVIVHGGGRVTVGGCAEEPTRVLDGVTLEDGAVVFRSTIGAGAVIGERSAVVGTDLAPGTVVPPGRIILNGEDFGPVEW